MFERFRQGVVEVVRGEGSLDAAGGDQLRKLMDQIRDLGQRNVVLDLRKVPLIDSAGLELLLDLLEQLRASGGGLRILAPNPLIAEVLAVTGVDQFFEIFTDETAAVGSFTR